MDIVPPTEAEGAALLLPAASGSSAPLLLVLTVELDADRSARRAARELEPPGC